LTLATITAFDKWLFTDSGPPFIGTGRCIPRLAASTFPAQRVGVDTSFEQATEKSEFAISIKVGERLITQYRHTYRLSWKLPLNAMRLKQGYKSLILCPQFCNQRGIAHCLEASVAEQVANLVTGRLSAYDGGHQMPSGPSGEAEENRGKKSPRVRA
jgi:hypothetical protein